jgi:GT2 family glycosyltransferase
MKYASGKAYDTGYNAGFNNGFDAGFSNGLAEGRDKGMVEAGSLFDGTSIIIPTYNQLGYLRQCVQSIREQTSESYEIIIVDNNSQDGTKQWLKSESGRLRYYMFENNRGFAGAVNQGLRMARGTTLVILNNDTLVTSHWLSNLLVCVHSSPFVGLAGPVTNYISGEQLVQTSYSSIDEMYQFATAHNHSQSGKWQIVSRITGFCLIMRRDVFRRLGYLDEGFEIGNCEDDDYGLRARLLGYDLVVAGDTFIHHFGSVSMKALDEKFDEVYQRNLDFYANKWGDPHSLLSEVTGHHRVLRSTIDFYPSHVAVQGVTPPSYWIEGNARYPSESISSLFPVTRISQVELKNWSKGERLSTDQLKWKKEALLPSAWLPLPEGSCVSDGDGRVYQVNGGQLRRFITPGAVQRWGMAERVGQLCADRLASFQQGIPILPPPVIVSDNI